jgi:hypothetical protein
MRFPSNPGDFGLWPDHVNHSVANFDEACQRMSQLGFTLTPRSDQLASDQAGNLKPTGMANRCIMLEEGYIEISGNVGAGDGPAVQSFRELLARHIGVHLLALGTISPEAQVERLSSAGFQPATIMNYQRMVGTETGEELARFTLAVTPRELIPELRLLMVRHETPGVIWQTRWVGHANGATGLAEVLVASADPAASADRLSRFLGMDSISSGAARRFELARGALTLLPGDLAQQSAASTAILPCVVGYVLSTPNIAEAKDFFAAGGIELLQSGPGWVSIDGGSSLGCTIHFAEPGARLPWHS